jgi:hypothetical protein
MSVALTRPDNAVTCPGGLQFTSAKKMTQHYNINYGTYYSRVTSGWSLEEALGITGRGLAARILTGEDVNPKLTIDAENHYIGRSMGRWYPVIVNATGKQLFLTADQIIEYRGEGGCVDE